ncbi:MULTISPECIES: DUF1843 domain-containing protein [Nitrospirillum]|jgi:hypothetical protein|uniref:DUF1843 domain-containing protein n=3 Tax=Nitrospirillum TaxID=1543705 RepID=A0A248JV27_9PROT|nr:MULTISPECIES: DUF1843 domain-containing protein [Nitrospirillum]MEE3623751.1 DUF1843 domain-containing protein [Nitrospirillum sp. BR 11752]ASG22573.1 DUF1843 domain-containing protein [Nitrospirillum amazonense CBAmc]MDG3444044.1 DUF1843 domain-containing protein [Nitrospirillum amazonense]MDZ5649672.1 DUF1843 domain-containing protein [Nitrospirillum sp. BR 11828]MEA1652598.1 DUF1843 domain-containing protein [Nitrospirillum sp. BR 11164]
MTIIQPYGVAITQAIASGDLEEMKRAKALAEDHVQRYGDIPTLLTHLKAAIAKLEAGKTP